jgi:hypothetical protein
MKISKHKPYDQMTTAELAVATAEYDKEDLNPGKPLTAADRALHRRAAAHARAKRLRIDNGARIVPTSIERGLLKKAESFAKRHKINLSQMVAHGLRMVMRDWAKAG